MLAATSLRRHGLDRLAARILFEGGTEDVSRAFEEQLDALRQIDRALSQVDRLVTDARRDPPLQSFWRGVKRDFEAEAHRLALRVGEAATRVARIDP